MELFELLHKLIEHTITYPEVIILRDMLIVISFEMFIVACVTPLRFKIAKVLAIIITIILIIISADAFSMTKELKPEYYDSFEQMIETNVKNITGDEVIITSDNITGNRIAVPKDTSYDEIRQIIEVIQEAYNNEYYSEIYRKYTLNVVDDMHPDKKEVRDRYGNTVGYETEYKYSTINYNDLMLINTESIKDDELDEIAYKDNSHTIEEDTEGNVLISTDGWLLIIVGIIIICVLWFG